MTVIDADLQAAFEYTFPLYEMARTRYLSVELAANPQRGINRLIHRRALLDHKSRAVTTPNNDTLYTSAWLDLSQGPIELTLPKFGSRYWSFQFMDAYTSTAELIGSRNTGEGDVKLWVMLTSDNTPVPAGQRVLRLPTRDVWMLGRILVDDAADAQVVHNLQDAIGLRVINATPAPWTNPSAPASTRGSPTDGLNYLQVVNDMLARNPAPRATSLVSAWQKFGILPGALVPASMAQTWSDALPALNKTIRGGLAAGASSIQNWRFPPPDVGVYGDNYRLRAGIALGGLGALPAIEAIYLSAVTDDLGQALNGLLSYRIKIGPAGVAAKSFWSLSMYQIEPDGRLFFADNAINRYAVGDRTRGLVKNADGSLDIVVQAAEPPHAPDKANWLPTPPGPFQLTLRAYLPTDALARGQTLLPVVTRSTP